MKIFSRWDIEKRGKFVYNYHMEKIVYAKSALDADKIAIESGVSSIELMRRAAEGLYDSYHFNGRTAIVCGPGNNGGDGYALACLLADKGKDVDIYAVDTPATADAQFYAEKCRGNIRECAEKALMGYDTVVDCVFGVGLNREAGGRYAEVIKDINDSGAFIISADIPSGLFADNGLGEICVKADMTVTFGAKKPGHLLNGGIDNCGEVSVCDIGTSPVPCARRISCEDIKEVFSPRKRNSNKGDFGYISIMGGSVKYSGAAKLANMAAAAMRTGAGVVRLCVGQSIAHSVSPYLLESTLYPMSDSDGFISFVEEDITEALKGTKALALGMGMGQGRDTDSLVSYIIENYTGKLILDADALNAVSRIGADILKRAASATIITPHPGEFARLVGCSISEVISNPINIAKDFALEHGVTVLLKGCTTVITDGERVFLSNKGCVGQAGAGSGDVLSGVLAAICGYYDDITMAAAAGSFVCGEAACLAEKENGSYSMVASDTVSKLPEAIMNIQK